MIARIYGYIMIESLLGIIILVADIWAIVNIINSNEKGSTKLIWTLVILLLPLIGLLIWFFAGPKSQART
jgi:hypothetical protein